MDNSYNHYKNYNDYPAKRDPAPQGKGYKSLPFFGQAEIIHDFTAEFTQKYMIISPVPATRWIAARSGKQNIAEVPPKASRATQVTQCCPWLFGRLLMLSGLLA